MKDIYSFCIIYIGYIFYMDNVYDMIYHIYYVYEQIHMDKSVN